MERHLYTIPEAREMLGGIAQATIYRLIQDGKIATVRIGRRRFVSATALQDFIALEEKLGL